MTQLRKHRWSCESNVKQLFVDNFDQFENAGGDTENIAFKAKLAYASDNWNKKKQSRRLTVEHVKKAMSDTFVHKQDNTFANMYV